MWDSEKDRERETEGWMKLCWKRWKWIILSQRFSVHSVGKGARHSNVLITQVFVLLQRSRTHTQIHKRAGIYEWYYPSITQHTQNGLFHKDGAHNHKFPNAIASVNGSCLHAHRLIWQRAPTHKHWEKDRPKEKGWWHGHNTKARQRESARMKERSQSGNEEPSWKIQNAKRDEATVVTV